MNDTVIKSASSLLASAKQLALDHSVSEQTALMAIAFAYASAPKKPEAKPTEKKPADTVAKP